MKSESPAAASAVNHLNNEKEAVHFGDVRDVSRKGLGWLGSNDGRMQGRLGANELGAIRQTGRGVGCSDYGRLDECVRERASEREEGEHFLQPRRFPLFFFRAI